MKLLVILCLVAAVWGKPTRFFQGNDQAIEGQYMVILEPGVDLQEAIGGFLDDAIGEGIEASIIHRFSTVVNGFVARVGDSSRGLHLLMVLPGVNYVEQDQRIQVQESVGSWGLDRIDQDDLPLNNDMTLDGYGEGTHIYVIDTGINPDHVRFGGRAAPVRDFVDPFNGTAIDCHGHGTHCAGTAASDLYGVARKANVYGIRILDCNGYGSISASVAAMDWIAEYGQRPAVASMSYGGGFVSRAEFEAAYNARQHGVVLVAAAGNSNADACYFSPAGSPDIITVGASDQEDERAYFSNYGRCVQLFAPGYQITSLSHDDNTAVLTFSGTSMACPHVAGIAAVLLGQGYSSEETYAKISSSATFGKIKNANGAPNRLANVS